MRPSEEPKDFLKGFEQDENGWTDAQLESLCACGRRFGAHTYKFPHSGLNCPRFRPDPTIVAEHIYPRRPTAEEMYEILAS